MITMHNFSIQDNTVTFQYENATLHVSISQRSLINTSVLKPENTQYKRSRVVFDDRVGKIICKLYTLYHVPSFPATEANPSG